MVETIMVGMEKLSVKGLALGGGVLWAFYILLAGWGAALGWGTSFVAVFQNLYIGYGPSFVGGLIGMVWGFFDGAVAGAIIALVYNWAALPRKRRR